MNQAAEGVHHIGTFGMSCWVDGELPIAQVEAIRTQAIDEWHEMLREFHAEHPNVRIKVSESRFRESKSNVEFWHQPGD